MKKIYKYKIPATHAKTASVMLPLDGKILTAGIQYAEICIWVEFDWPENTEPHMVERRFEVFGTGWEIPEDMGVSREYIGTVFDGPFVWHVYEYTGV